MTLPVNLKFPMCMMYIHHDVYVYTSECACFFFFFLAQMQKCPSFIELWSLCCHLYQSPAFRKYEYFCKKNVLYIVHEIVIGYHTSDAFSQDYIFFSLFYLPYFGHIPQITLCYSKTFSVKGCGRED